MKKVLVILILTTQALTAADAPETLSAPVKSWLAAQGEIHTWSADLVQTRTLQSLTEPLTAKGRVWFEAPGRFRWELGQPPQTIAISTLTNLYIIYPRLKRVEVIELAGQQGGPWRSALDMLEAGFPRTEKDMLEHYTVASQNVAGSICKLDLHPRVDMVRRMMPRLEIDFDTNDFMLRGTELEFADGSTMRNDFTNIVKNPTVDETNFSPAIPANYTIVHPQVRH
jgi:outer membrane lipoprotein-sorting protein